MVRGREAVHEVDRVQRLPDHDRDRHLHRRHDGGEHGSAPRRAGQNVANPSGLLLAAVQMLVHIGQPEIAEKIHNAWLKTIEDATEIRRRVLLAFELAERQTLETGQHPALNTLVGGPTKLYEGSRSQIQGAIEALVNRAIKSCDIRKDLDPFDLLRALVGVSNVATSPDWQQSAKRLVDILITGSRPVK